MCAVCLCRDSHSAVCGVRGAYFPVWGSPSLFAIIFKHTASPHPRWLTPSHNAQTPKTFTIHTRLVSQASGTQFQTRKTQPNIFSLPSRVVARANRPPPRARLDQVALPSRLSSPPRRAQHSHSYTRITHTPTLTPPLFVVRHYLLGGDTGVLAPVLVGHASSLG